MRRRRRPSVVWLNPDLRNRLGVVAPAVATEFDPGIFEVLLTVPGTATRGTPSTVVFPVVHDDAQAIATETLADEEGSAYRLRRIVGKIFIETLFPTSSTVQAGEITFCYVTAGLIVLRTQANNLPLSSSALDYDVAAVNQWRDPWMWRRTWQIGKPLDINGTVQFAPRPRTNFTGDAFTATFDGPHVDAKVARIISNEERLFLVFTANAGDGSGGNLPDFNILITGDLRCLASMRKMAGNRRNASR